MNKMTKQETTTWLVDFLKSQPKQEVGRSNAHWYGYGSGVFDRPNGEIVGCKFQDILDHAVKLGLIATRRTAKNRSFIRAVAIGTGLIEQ
jgi:hypothetical protein